MPTFPPKHAGPIVIRSKETKVVLTEMMMNDVLSCISAASMSVSILPCMWFSTIGGGISLHSPYIVPKP